LISLTAAGLIVLAFLIASIPLKKVRVADA
jgi:hypothetical protein